MKLQNKARLCRRIVSLILALLLMGGLLISCSSNSGETLMRIENTELSVNTYELLLSRMKGTLAYNGYEVDSDEFWDIIAGMDGMTYNEYFCTSILEAASELLVKLYLFDEVYKLELPQSYLDDIDVYMQDLLENDFEGSKTAFNQAMSEYGINMNMLRENYIMEDKIDYLSTYLSSYTSDGAREEYYQANYVCFRQILFPLYEYQYETDENGDIVYYRQGTNYICYDTKNGSTKTATDGSLKKDENGDTVYYTDDGRIAYDTVNGYPMELDADNDGYVDYVPLSDEDAAAVTEQANSLYELIEAGDYSTFEEYGAQLTGDDGIWDAYPNGIFLNVQGSYSLQYLNDLTESLSTMAVGDTLLFQSDNAYHLVMKYELTTGAYANSDNADWFGSFEDEVVEEIILAKCEEYMDQVVIDEEVLAQAMDMKEVAANWNY